MPDGNQTKRQFDYTEFEQQSTGWPGSNYSRQIVRLKTRRVQSDNRDEAQIEISICEIKGQRAYRTSATFTMQPAEIVQFIAALTGSNQ